MSVDFTSAGTSTFSTKGCSLVEQFLSEALKAHALIVMLCARTSVYMRVGVSVCILLYIGKSVFVSSICLLVNSFGMEIFENSSKKLIRLYYYYSNVKEKEYERSYVMVLYFECPLTYSCLNQ